MTLPGSRPSHLRVEEHSLPFFSILQPSTDLVSPQKLMLSVLYYLLEFVVSNNMLAKIGCTCIYRAPVAQLVEHRTVTREVVSSTPAGPTLRVYKITEEEVLPL